MEFNDIFATRNKSFVKLNEAADYLSNIIRENVVIFEIDTQHSQVSFLTESKNIITCEYEMDNDRTLLREFSFEGVDSVLSNDNVDSLVSGKVSEMVTSLNENRYDTADGAF
jgi:hypothetical protein